MTRLKRTAIPANRMIPFEPPKKPPSPTKSAPRPAMITHVRAWVAKRVREIDMVVVWFLSG